MTRDFVFVCFYSRLNNVPCISDWICKNSHPPAARPDARLCQLQPIHCEVPAAQWAMSTTSHFSLKKTTNQLSCVEGSTPLSSQPQFFCHTTESYPQKLALTFGNMKELPSTVSPLFANSICNGSFISSIPHFINTSMFLGRCHDGEQ